ncbi:MAG: lytic transglycosylase domain-containing protein [Methylacidiphilales bacterium]|nr:lytic transglycosylase domain-containing protein [Candidatus Methylacidiphilales bacterium]
MLRRYHLLLLALLLVILAGQVGYLYWQEHQPKESIYDPLIVSVARNEGVDPFLVRALIWRESRFDPLTHGEADEHGLMQVTPDVGQMWAKANKIDDFTDDALYDPETNIRAGTWYLNRALKHWSQTDDPVTFALAEYNAGRKNALKWVDPLAPLDHAAFLDRITYPSTRKYVEVILAKRDQYRAVFANNRWYREDAQTDQPVTQSQ